MINAINCNSKSAAGTTLPPPYPPSSVGSTSSGPPSVGSTSASSYRTPVPPDPQPTASRMSCQQQSSSSPAVSATALPHNNGCPPSLGQPSPQVSAAPTPSNVPEKSAANLYSSQGSYVPMTQSLPTLSHSGPVISSHYPQQASRGSMMPGGGVPQMSNSSHARNLPPQMGGANRPHWEASPYPQPGTH